QISGAKTPRLSINSATRSASYWVVVTNGAGSLFSSIAGLSVDGAPAMVSTPASVTNLVGSTAFFSVSATGAAPLSYRWLKNGTNLSDSGNISGSFTTQLRVDSITLTDAGSYSVIVSNSHGMATSTAALLSVVNLSPALSPLWSVSPGDGKPWLTLSGSTSVPNQRTIAYNALSNQLYLVSRSSNTTSNYVVYVLNATNGSLLYTLKTNGVQCNVGKGGIGLVGIGVADDGAIYACNCAPDAEGIGGTDPSSLFRVYRWADANPNTSPSLIFSGDPSGSSSALRLGDNLAVRGAGTNTQVLVDMTFFGGTAGTNGFAAVLSPANAFMTNFTARWFTTTNFATTVGRSLEFDGTNNAIWQKGPDNSLYKTSFTPSASLGGNQIAATNVMVVSKYPAGLMGIGLDPARNLAAGVFSNSPSSADTLNLYDIINATSPSFLSQFTFPINPRTANANKISQTFFKNDLLFSFDANNGLLVLQILPPASTIKLLNPQKLAGGAFQFSYSNNDGRAYTVFASSNLSTWTPLGVATQAAPAFFQFTDPQATNPSHRFYQLRWP
ncbi:MAG TPA: immunoglobulin domain-containing protein, partial [Candidatus Dormibacteraeota bacterium]|nr:immunoglobulin domain-containing protein [Candidatus Dormibacteraeota bacterium]